MMDMNPGCDPLIKEDFLSNPEWKKGFRRLAHYGLSFDLQINPNQFNAAADIIRECPDIPVILNHFGFPSRQDIESGFFLKVIRKLQALPYIPGFTYLCIMCDF